MFTLEARQAISCAAARMDSGGTLSTIIKGQQCDSPPDICAPRQLSATEPVFWVPWARRGIMLEEMRGSAKAFAKARGTEIDEVFFELAP